MGAFFRLAASYASAIGLFLSSGAALAQTAPPPPPVFSAVDGNGVDLASGKLNIQDTQASVGDGASGLSRVYLGRWLRDNLTGGIDLDAQGKYVVSFGNLSAKFTRANATAPFVPDVGSAGQQLVLVESEEDGDRYFWLLRDGTVVRFYSNLGSIYPLRLSVALIEGVERPNGEAMFWVYDAYHDQCDTPCLRVRTVMSTRGWAINYEYAGDTLTTGGLTLSRVRAMNYATEFCDLQAPNCTTANTWSSTTFTYANPAPLNTTMTATDSLGRATVYTLVGTAAGVTPESDVITKIVDPSGTTTDIGYNGNLQVTSIARGGQTWTYSYTILADGNRQATVLDPNSHTRVVVTTPEGAMVSETDGGNRTTSYIVDPATGLITRVTNPEGDYVAYAYDARGNVTSVTRAPKPGSGLSNVSITTAVYPTTCAEGEEKVCNQPTSVTQAGETTDFTYDVDHGGVLTVTRAPGADGKRPQTRYEYAETAATIYVAPGQTFTIPSFYQRSAERSCMTMTLATCAGGADETKVTYDYSYTGTGNGLLKSTTAWTGATATATTTYAYTMQGDVASVDGPLTAVVDRSSARYDSERQLLGEIGIDPDGADTGRRAVAKKYQYRPDGQLDWMETGSVANDTASGWSGFTAQERVTVGYDTSGRRVRETLEGGGATRALTQYAYDAGGRLQCVTQRMNTTAFGSAPASACSLGVEGTDGPDRITRYTYDAADQEIVAEEGWGSPDIASVRTTTYTGNGQVATLEDGNFNKTTYEYDGFDRLKKVRYPNPALSSPTSSAGSSTSDYEEYSYSNTTWNVTSFRRRDGSTRSFSYDARHNLTWRNNPEAPYTYDNFDRIKSAAENGQSMFWTYDVLGRLVNVNGIAGAVSYQYNAAGQRTRTTWPDNFYVSYDLDATGAVTKIRENGAASGVGVLASFDYDNLGRRTGLTRGNGSSTTYGYDPVSRLASLTIALPDSAKNQAVTFTYNAASQIKTRVSNNTAYAWPGLYNASRDYAVNGLNQVTVSGSSTVAHSPRGNLTSDGTTTYGYDGDNRLTSVSNGATLSYDPLGRLYQVTPGSGAGRRYLYDGSDLIMEYAPTNGAIVRRFVFGPGEDEPLVWYEGSGTGDRRWFTADAQGSIIGVTTGSTTAINSYDEYGVPAPGNVGAFQYTGQLILPEAGAYHFKARVYNHQLGRFMQTDPIGYNSGPNLYAYSGDDPVNLTDPTGLLPGDPRGLPFTDLWGPTVIGPQRGGVIENLATNVGNVAGNFQQIGNIGNLVAELVVTFSSKKCKTENVTMFPNGDVLTAQAAAARNPFPGSVMVGIHGRPEGVSASGNMSQPTTAGQLVSKLESAGWMRGQPITLASCRTARGTFPQTLANASGSVVHAPQGWCFFNTGVAESRDAGPMTSDHKRVPGARMPWTTFNPKKPEKPGCR